MAKTTNLESQRKDFAAAFKGASEQLKVAQGTVANKTLETALWGWRWGRVVNDIHGTPPGNVGKLRGQLTDEQTLAYCVELGVGTNVRANGQRGGASTISDLRLVAARVSTEDHLRELLAEYGSIWMLAKSFRGDQANKGSEAVRNSQRSSQKRSKSHYRFAPPQSWSAYLVEQSMSRGEISAAMALALEAIGPEETFKIWDRAGRPCHSTSNGKVTTTVI